MSVATPALPARTERFWAALLAATLMNLPLGSVYAFSVLLRPIEQELAIPRSALSLVFALASRCDTDCVCSIVCQRCAVLSAKL